MFERIKAKITFGKLLGRPDINKAYVRVLKQKNFNFAETVKDSVFSLLLSAGSMEHREEQFEEIRRNNPCDTEILILEGCNHGNGMYKQTKIYQEKIKSFNR